jgi:hypothetical protein
MAIFNGENRWIQLMMLMSYESMTGNIVWLVTGTMEFSMTFPSYWQFHHPN